MSLAILPFLFNALVDPLWYFSGNHFGPNYPFNERLSKANLFRDQEDETDCLILGSSRTTLLDARRFEGRNCFNYAVSQANLNDALKIARYVKSRGAPVRTLVVALDAFMLSQARVESPPLPAFYETGGAPPFVALTYLSVDSLELSFKTLRRRAPNDRLYDDQFVTRAIDGVGPYVPPDTLDVPARLDPDEEFNQFSLGPFSLPKEVAELARVFPEARLIGYVPPVTADYLARLELAGTLGSYLRTISEAVSEFDALVDFSVPSAVTTDPDQTYDGSHYYKHVNDRVVEVLSQYMSTSSPSKASRLASKERAAEQPFGQAVHELSTSDYAKAFRSRVQTYLGERKRAAR